MKIHLLKKLLIITLSYSVGAFSQVTVNLNPVKDNSIYSENNNSNGVGLLFSGRTGGNNGNNNRRALMQFDLTSIPSEATITNVSLSINVSRIPVGAGSHTFNLHQLTTNWGEGTSSGGGTGAAAVAPDATWTAAMFGSSNWVTPGGDFITAPISSLALNNVGNYTFLSTTNFVNTVQQWIDTPSTNNGIILIGDEIASRSARQFGSKDIGIAPTLNVTYSTLSTDNLSINSFSIHPNPAKSNFTIVLPPSIKTSSVEVYNILGKQIHRQLVTTLNNLIDVSLWGSGSYFIKITSSGNSKTKHFIKQ